MNGMGQTNKDFQVETKHSSLDQSLRKAVGMDPITGEEEDLGEGSTGSVMFGRMDGRRNP